MGLDTESQEVNVLILNFDTLGEDEDNINIPTGVVEKPKNLIVPNTQESSVTNMPPSDIKSENTKPNAKSWLNVG